MHLMVMPHRAQRMLRPGPRRLVALSTLSIPLNSIFFIYDRALIFHRTHPILYINESRETRVSKTPRTVYGFTPFKELRTLN